MSTLGCFDAYIRKVFDWTGMGSHLEDGRTHPRIPMAKIVEGLLMGMVFRSPAISEIEWECREGVLKERIGAISDDSFGYGLEHLGPASLQEGWTRMARLMKRKGMLREGRYKPYVVGVLDGIETLASYSRSCDRCLRREIVGGDTPRIQYYHRSVVVCLVGYTFPIPIGMEMMRPGENEVACGERLLIRLVAGLGRRFLDIVVGDALYCTPAFFSTCRALGIAPVSVLKENQPELLREAAWQKKERSPAFGLDSPKEKMQVWDLPEVLWDTAGQDVRVIWGEGMERVVRERGKKREAHREEKRRIFVLCKTLATISPAMAYDLGRDRWQIDASLFQDMTRNWFLKHSTLHFSRAYENLLMLRLIAYFLFMSFMVRHLNARRMKKWRSATALAKALYLSAVWAAPWVSDA